jgi:hypothetical protein
MVRQIGRCRRAGAADIRASLHREGAKNTKIIYIRSILRVLGAFAVRNRR